MKEFFLLGHRESKRSASKQTRLTQGHRLRQSGKQASSQASLQAGQDASRQAAAQQKSSCNLAAVCSKVAAALQQFNGSLAAACSSTPARRSAAQMILSLLHGTTKIDANPGSSTQQIRLIENTKIDTTKCPDCKLINSCIGACAAANSARLHHHEGHGLKQRPQHDLRVGPIETCQRHLSFPDFSELPLKVCNRCCMHCGAESQATVINASLLNPFDVHLSFL